MKNLINIFKTLSDETRLRLLLLIYRHDHCVCELAEILELPQPKVSKHLTKLRDLGYVQTRRESQYIFYTLNTEDDVMLQVLKSIEKDLSKYEILNNDSKRMPTCKVY
jgi:ArsR family transcriptional regulator, arsenate/arsenite/antimonite-responsive transcriptional repressor